MDYCDIDYLEEYGYFDNVPESARAMLTVHITQASDMWDRLTGRKWGIPVGEAAQTRTFTMLNGKLDPKYGNKLWLDEDIYAIVTIATVAAGVTLTWLPDQPPYYAIVRDGGAWEDPTTITGFWAYSNQPPAIVVNTVARLATWLYHQRESVDAQGNTPNPPNNIPNDVLQIAKSLRRVRLP